MKTLFVVFMAIFAVAQATANLDLLKVEWGAFKNQYNKSYTEGEDLLRMKIFMDNKEYIAEHNRKYEAGGASYKLGMNEFGDMHHDEFVRMMNGLKKSSDQLLGSEKRPGHRTFVQPANVQLPYSVDWRDSGAVSAVKNQGKCGSCWAFAATGSLEGQHFRKTGVMVTLSEQNLVDCSRPWGNDGCNGGLPNFSFNYIKDNKGIDTESLYPYEAMDSACRFNRSNVGAVDFGFVDVQSGDEESLKSAVATVGPISIGIDASQYSFQFYSDGVYNEPRCSSDYLDHGVLAVGYGNKTNGGDYWLVKNSWGTGWGQQGYILMARNRDNQCGVATAASYPIV